jgi:hypothetical protein
MSAEPVRRPAPPFGPHRTPDGMAGGAQADRPPCQQQTPQARAAFQTPPSRPAGGCRDGDRLMAVVLTTTAGLGVVAIIAVPIATVLIGSLVAERVIREKRGERSGRTRRPSRVYDLAATDRRPASSPRARPGPTVTERRGRRPLLNRRSSSPSPRSRRLLASAALMRFRAPILPTLPPVGPR